VVARAPEDALAPARAIVAASEAAGGPGEVSVVVLPHVVAPSVAAGEADGMLAVTLRPAAPGHPPGALDAALALPGAWDPVVILGRDELLSVEPAQRGAIVAHELGHAVGLEHRPEPENLMNAAVNLGARCLGSLDEPQRAAFKRPNRRVGWIGLLGALGFGCPDGDPDPTDTDTDAPAPPACVDGEVATVEIGLGNTGFVLATAGGEATFEAGPQGGYHVWGALRVTGIDPGPGTFVSDDNPWVDFTVEQDGVVGGYIAQQRPFLTVDGAGQLTTQQLVLSHPNPPALSGTQATLRAKVVDANGVCGEATVVVTLKSGAMPDGEGQPL
jgi:hypothetical protein